MKKILFAILCLIFITTPVFAQRREIVHDGITRAGDILQIAIPLSALAYSSAIRDWQGVRQLGYSAGSTFAATQIMKYAIREERPYQDEDTKGHTFPSGHTSSAFAGAGYWQMRYGWYVGAPMYMAAAFTGYSRNHANMHSWFDISVGAAIGIGFNLLFTSRYNNENTLVAAIPVNGGVMFCFNTKF